MGTVFYALVIGFFIILIVSLGLIKVRFKARVVKSEGDRYPMCDDQPAQIDCRNTSCMYHVDATCTNISPAITLTSSFEGINVSKAQCWSYKNKND